MLVLLRDDPVDKAMCCLYEEPRNLLRDDPLITYCPWMSTFQSCSTNIPSELNMSIVSMSLYPLVSQERVGLNTSLTGT